MLHLFEKVSSGASRMWCRRMHPAPMWPIHNHYICPQCQRQWPVLWSQKEEMGRAATKESHRAQQLQPAERSL
jgi:hypothetical protein